MDIKKDVMTSKGRFTRCFGEAGHKKVISEKTAHTPVLGNKTQTLALVEGDIIAYHTNDSFKLHGGTTHELMDFQVIATASKAFVITILLKGKLKFGYDHLMFDLDAGVQQSAVIVNLTKPASFYRNIYKDNYVSKLNIVLPISWIKSRCAESDEIGHFISCHLASCTLNLNPKLLDLSIQLIKLGSPLNFIEKMKVEVLIQQLLLDIFEQVGKHKAEVTKQEWIEDDSIDLSHSVNGSERVIDQLMTYIEANIEKTITVSELANIVSMSISSLQRKFKNNLGCSVQSYIRTRRLELAKQQLERGFMTITEAAYTSGYRYPSNFTNAFKKIFGYPPQEVISK